LFDFPQFKPHGSVLVRNKTFDLLHFVWTDHKKSLWIIWDYFWWSVCVFGYLNLCTDFVILFLALLFVN
jgi:hypothetical protein